MLSLINSNHDPSVDLYYPEGSDYYTKVTYDKEKCLSDRYTAPITSPAYTPSIPFLATAEPTDTFLMGDEVIRIIPAREIDELKKELYEGEQWSSFYRGSCFQIFERMRYRDVVIGNIMDGENHKIARHAVSYLRDMHDQDMNMLQLFRSKVICTIGILGVLTMV
nr:hypothetical protein [Tanacetum cinerariifolium]